MFVVHMFRMPLKVSEGVRCGGRFGKCPFNELRARVQHMFERIDFRTPVSVNVYVYILEHELGIQTLCWAPDAISYMVAFTYGFVRARSQTIHTR